MSVDINLMSQNPLVITVFNTRLLLRKTSRVNLALLRFTVQANKHTKRKTKKERQTEIIDLQEADKVLNT